MKNLINYVFESLNEETKKSKPKTIKGLQKILKTLETSKWNTIDVSKMTSFERLFKNWDGEFGDMSNWDTSNVTNFDECFYDCKLPNSCGIEKWNMSNAETIYGMFCGCSIKTYDKNSKNVLDLNSWDVSNVESFSNTFQNSNFLFDISKWNTSNAKNMFLMFSGSLLEFKEPQWYKDYVKKNYSDHELLTQYSF